MPTTVSLRDQEIRAILQGRQTMVIKPLGGVTVNIGIGIAGLTKPDKDAVIRVGESPLWRADGGLWRKKCPFGVEGTNLLVREPWAQPGAVPRSNDPIRSDRPIEYRADQGRMQVWRSSATMPSWAARLELEVKEIRVKRLHDLTEDDAFKAGVRSAGGGYSHNGGLTEDRTPIDALRAAWDASDTDWPWESNPHIWVVSFAASVIDRQSKAWTPVVMGPATLSRSG